MFLAKWTDFEARQKIQQRQFTFTHTWMLKILILKGLKIAAGSA